MAATAVTKESKILMARHIWRDHDFPFPSTFIYSSVLVPFLAVGVLSVPVQVQLLSVRLKPPQMSCQMVPDWFSGSTHSESFFPLRNMPSIQEIQNWKERAERINRVSMSLNRMGIDDLLWPNCRPTVVRTIANTLRDLWPCHIDPTTI